MEWKKSIFKFKKKKRIYRKRKRIKDLKNYIENYNYLIS